MFEIPQGMARKVFDDKYARTKENGSKESWPDVSRRVSAGNAILFQQQPQEVRSHYENVVGGDFEENLRSLMQDGILVTAGRHLQHGDENQLTKSGDRMMNCVTSITSFLNFWLLMQGCGVGRLYSSAVCKVNWDFMPNVRLVLDVQHPDYEPWIEPLHEAKHIYNSESQDVRWYKVKDSAIGWMQVITILETAASEQRHKDKLFIFDFSDVRERGKPIRGMQNRPASGPVPFIRSMMDVLRIKGAGMQPWKQALVIDHYLAQAVLSGGVRRAARLCCIPWTDAEQNVIDFITCKAGGQYFWSANNSVLVDEDFWRDVHSEKSCKARRIFDAIISASFYDRTGEPGLINVDKLKQNDSGIEQLTAQNYLNPVIAKEMELHPKTYAMLDDIIRSVKKLKFQMIVNPCVTADTVIDTSEGPQRVGDLVGKRFYVPHCGQEYRCDGFYLVGEEECVDVTFSDATVVRCSVGHKFSINGKPAEVRWLRIGSVVDTVDGTVTIDNIETVGYHGVYNCTVNQIHTYTINGIVNHQCGEISLHIAGGYCCIGDINLANLPKDFNVALKAVCTQIQFLLNVNKMNFLYDFEVKRTNRIGVGLIGVHEFAWDRFGLTFHDLLDPVKSREFWEFISWMRVVGEAYLESLKEEYPDFVVPHTAFTIKPAGTTAKIMKVTEGWHLPAYQAMIRYVQYRKDDPRVPDLVAQGYPFKDVSGSIRDTVVVGYPTINDLCDSMADIGVNPTCAGDVSMDDHFRWISLGEKHWLGEKYDNQISYTAKFKHDTTYEQYRRMMKNNMPNVKCCSVMPQLPDNDIAYAYQPETKISIEEYHNLMKTINQQQSEDYDDKSLECAGGACPIEQNLA